MKSAEELTEALKTVLGPNLVSSILYGSKSMEDHNKSYSDINVLVVVREIDIDALKMTMPVVKEWCKNGNPPPLFFTEERINRSEDVFPVEFLDIKASHRVLFGKDPFEDLQIHTNNLRHQLEYELRSKLIHLREQYVWTGGRHKEVIALMAKILPSFSVLFKGVLRLIGETPPISKRDVFEMTEKFIPINSMVFQSVLKLREGENKPKEMDHEFLLAEMLKSVELVVDFVDQHKES